MVERIGSYTVDAELGRGGMGAVYAGRAPDGTPVALKIVLDAALTAPDARQRFEREARACAALDHPNVVRVLDVGSEGGRPFLAMERLEGESLQGRLRRGPLPPDEAARLTAALARAMQHVHSQGLIHRDLKPDNVLLTPRGPVVIDFGLARDAGQERERLTLTGEILGTPAYMAPEQANGDTHGVGPLADVYALGAILFAALTGRPPFTSSSPLNTLRAVLEEPPPRPRSLNPEVSPELEEVCLRCLEKLPEDRYAAAEDLARALESASMAPAPSLRAPLLGLAALAALVLILGAAVALRGPHPAEEPLRPTVEAPPPSDAPPFPASPEGPTLEHATALLAERRWEDALAALKGANRDDPQVWLLRGRVHQRRLLYRGDPVDRAASQEAFARARLLAPDHPEVIVWSAWGSSDAETQERAARAFAAGQTTHLAQAWAVEARRLWQEAQQQRGAEQAETQRRALERVGRALELDPRCFGARIYQQSFWNSHRVHDPLACDKAIAASEEAIALDPREPFHRLRLGFALKTKGEDAQRTDPEAASEWYREAIAAYQGALDLEPEFMSALIEKGWALNLLDAATGRTDPALMPAAIEALEKAVAVSPRNAFPLHVLACIYQAAGREDDALRSWESALSLGPPPNEVRNYVPRVTRIYERRGDLRRLRGVLARTLEGVADAGLRRDLEAQIAGIDRRLEAPR